MRLKLPSKNIRHNTTVTRIFNGISRFRISPWGIKLCRNAQIPTTTSPLKIFEPTTLLMAISLLPASAALMLTEASGALVPMATMVSPMMTLGTFRIPAREELPSTKKSAPLIRSINPTSNNMYSISCPFLQQASVFLEKSIKIETFTASKMIDKSLVAYNNNRSDGRDDDYHSGQLHVSFSYHSRLPLYQKPSGNYSLLTVPSFYKKGQALSTDFVNLDTILTRTPPSRDHGRSRNSRCLHSRRTGTRYCRR